MRIIAAVPSSGLLAGAALGAAWPDLPILPLALMLAGALVLSAVALSNARVVTLTLAVAFGCALCGTLLAQRAWQGNWRSSLRLAFESIARDERRRLADRGIVAPLDDRASVVLRGVLRDDAVVTEGGAVSLRVEVLWIGRAGSAALDAAANPVQGEAILTVAGELAQVRMPEWRRGRLVRLAGVLRRPSRYLDPGVFDQERALARRGVSLVGSVKSAALVEVVGRGGAFSEMGGALRAFARQAIAASVGRWSPPAAAIVAAIVIGDRTGLSADIERRLQEAGTYHVIAISGGNIAILAGLALTAFRLAGFLGPSAMVTAIVGLLAYGAIVSGGASVDRATLMAVVFFAGRALDLRGPPLNTLALIAGILVASRPLAVADPGFLLTFGASAAIIAVAQSPADVPRSSLFRAAVGLGMASLAAEAMLFPVGAAFFSRVTLAGLMLNFVAIPAMAVAQVAGMLTVPLFACAPGVAMLVGGVAALGAEVLVRSAVLVDLLPVLTWRLPAPAAWSIALYYASLIVWWAVRSRAHATPDEHMPRRITQRVAGVVAIGTAVWILAAPWAWWASRGDGLLHVTFLDVGQGDAALIRFPRGHTMLIDAGGTAAASSFDVGDRVVGQVLRTLGIRRLDTLVLTHGDADHVGGAASIVEAFRPRDVWEGVPVPPSAALKAIAARVRDSGARWTRVQRGDEMSVDDVRIVVRHPPPADWERQDVRNDDSIVIELQWHDVSIVFTGDVGAGIEAELADSFATSPLRILKVPHHGSLTSSSTQLIGALHPRLAIVSAGRSNSFGHPAPAVLRRYAASQVELFRTDRDGAVTLTTEGSTVDVDSFTQRHLRLTSGEALHLLPLGLEFLK